MDRWCALLILFVIISVTEAGSIIFPGQLDHAEGDACTTNTGGSGTCSRSCEHSSSLSEPRKCGIKDSRFLICCNSNSSKTSEPFTDISEPKINFECGRNTLKNVFNDEYDGSFFLRPDASLPPGYEVESPPDTVSEFPAEEHKKLVKRQADFNNDVFPVVGGNFARENAWPWMALLGKYDEQGIRWFCAGVLINEQWVLTALHCFIRENVEIVRLGEHNYFDDLDLSEHEDFGVAETVFYPDYKHPEAYHDLALLRLDSKVFLKEHISPVCLPWGRESDKNIIGQQATLTGWGDTEYKGLPSSILQEVNITVFPSEQCDRGYSNLPHYPSTWPRGIGEDILCAGDLAGGRDSCQGDSGGPLVSEDASGRFVLAGIVSKGYGCGHKDYLGLYANLRYSPYLAWIKKVAFSAP